MSNLGVSTYATPHIGDHVQHPLYPELGTGTILTASGDDISPGVRVGRIHWATGQETAHNLGILRIIPTEPTPPTDSTWTTPCVVGGIPCPRPNCRC